MTTELTDEKCNEFRRLPVSFNDMVRAIYKAGAADRAARIGEFPALPEPDHATVSPWDKDATQMVFFTADQMRAYAAQAVEADRAARGVPEGWRLVPAEPTQEMYQSVIHNGYYHDDPAKVRSVLRSEYQDMLAAAPQPAARGVPSAPDPSDPADIIAGALSISRGHAIEMMRQAVKEAQPAAQPCPTCESLAMESHAYDAITL